MTEKKQGGGSILLRPVDMLGASTFAEASAFALLAMADRTVDETEDRRRTDWQSWWYPSCADLQIAKKAKSFD